ncbi:MAG: Two component regulator three Y domain protein [Gemmatimonadetes bacterium]|nr:Two component regulator three Y domain protein [Gemmatimonadota bacterium]
MKERDALVALFENTGGSDWINRDGWLSDAELGNWYGVDTNTQGHVTRIVLDENNLVGSLPPELGVLVHLSRLSLQRNGLIGEIPPELGRLARIDTLDLYINGLSGAIPQELLELEDVAMLLLGFNQLSGSIPPGLGSMPGLERLWLNHNNLSGPVPPELGELGAQLQWLDIQENGALEGALPREFMSLTGLLRFEWGGTSLCSPSDEVFQAWLMTVPTWYGRGPACP